jgi:hypothetical protein
LESRGIWLGAVLVTALVVLGLDVAAFAVDFAAVGHLREALDGNEVGALMEANERLNELVNGKIYPFAYLALVVAMSGWTFTTAAAYRADGRAARWSPPGAAATWLVPGLNVILAPLTLGGFARHVTEARPDLRLRLRGGLLLWWGAWVAAWLFIGLTWAIYVVATEQRSLETETVLLIKRIGLLGSFFEGVAMTALVPLVFTIHHRWTELLASPSGR